MNQTDSDQSQKTAHSDPERDGTEDQARPKPSLPVVGIAASAGGLKAFKEFFQALDSKTGRAYVLIQHLAPEHESLMAELIQKSTAMPVVQVNEDLMLEADHVYTIAPNTQLILQEGGLVVEPLCGSAGTRNAADSFFRSMAVELQEAAIGIVLTGTGSDGTHGLREVKHRGGMTIVQQPESAEHSGMPQSVISADAADFVVPVAEMPELLERHAAGWSGGDTNDFHPERLHDDDAYEAVLKLVVDQTGIDFLSYRSSTVKRRIGRRMGFNQIIDLSDYEKCLAKDAKEAQALAADLMIGVTRFFRDHQVWEKVYQKALVPLATETPANRPIRCWVSGCSTGEEAYTLAMLLSSALEDRSAGRDVKIFASDINERSLGFARTGIYPSSVLNDVPAQFHDKYFINQGEGRVEIVPQLRDQVVFARQNLLTDPPFARLDFISCRNLLIYLRKKSQAMVLRRLHFGLKPKGHLLLGTSEKVTEHSASWHAVSRTHRLYLRGDAAPDHPSLGDLSPNDRARNMGAQAGAAPSNVALGARRHPDDRIRQAVLEVAGPALLVVDEDGRTQFTSGNVDSYVQFPRGRPDLSLAAVLRPGLVARVRSATRAAFENEKTTVLEKIILGEDSKTRVVSLRIAPLHVDTESSRLAVVVFEPVMDNEDASEPRPSDLKADEIVRRLDRELKATREDLQSTVEQLESSNEELNASSDEIMSYNEELQSANEELETSKEELQSLNEELNTVNRELRQKVEEQKSTNDDIANLLDSTDIATLFLDGQLCVKRYTPATRKLYRFIAGDVGRPLNDLSAQFDDPNLFSDALQSQQNGVVKSRRIKASDGVVYVRRVSPYRQSEGKSSGVVVTFADVTELDRSEQLARNRLNELEAIYDNSPVGLAYHDADLRWRRVNSRLEEINGFSAEESLGKKPGELLGDPLGNEVEAILQAVFDSGERREGIDWHAALPGHGDGVVKDFRASFFPMRDEDGDIVGVTSVVEDVSDIKQSERRLQIEAAVAQIYAGSDDFDVMVKEVLGLLTRSLGEAVGEYWEQIPGRATLRCKHFVAALEDQDGSQKDLQDYFDDIEVPLGESIIGQAWNNRTPVWVSRLGDESDFLRREEASTLGLQSVLSFPVIHNAEVVGLFAIFTQRRYKLDGQMMAMISALGRDLATHRERLDAKAQVRSNQQRLQQSLRQLESVYQIAPVGLFSITAQNFVINANAAMDDFSNGDVRGGRSVEAPFSSLTTSLLDCVARSFKEPGKTIHHDLDIEIGQGEEGRNYLIRVRATKDQDLAVGMVSDITQIRLAELRMRESERNRSAFLAVLGHELRNPMSAVSTAADLLTQQPEALDKTVTIIKNNVQIVGRLLDDLLDLTRVEKGKIHLQRKPVDLIEVVERALDTVRGTALTKQLDIKLSRPDAPVVVQIDADRVEQILWNVLSNAVKFSPEGTAIDVRVSCGEHFANVKIQDSGPGIARQDQQRVFNPFEQVKPEDSPHSGLGIGLPLARQLAELHDGSLELESAGRGHGSAFTLSLRRSTESEIPDDGGNKEADASTARPDMKDKRIAVVDDNQASADMLVQILGLEGAVCRAFYDGESLLEAYAEFTPEIIILDLGLPGISGFEVAEQLREQEYAGLLIALTGFGHEKARQRTKDASFDYHVNKPADVDTILGILGTD